MPLPQYLQKSTVSAPFKMLVAHHTRASDPSKGEAGNPVKIRNGFEMQVVTTQHRTASLAYVQDNAPALVIKVNSADFANSAIGNPPPYYDLDSIQALASDIQKSDQITPLSAGVHFGQAHGHGVGAIPDLASELAEALNTLDGIEANVSSTDNTKVEVATSAIDDNLVLTVVSYSYLLLNGVPPFTVEDINGNTLYNPADGNTSTGTVVSKSKDVGPIKSI